MAGEQISDFKKNGTSALLRGVATHHLAFDSHYRLDYEVVEERHGATRLYPHTQQLPVILRALNLEFLTGVPNRIARTDKRDGFHKRLREEAVRVFCSCLNAARKDDLRLYSILDHNLVARIAIVQHITEDTPRGATHRFRFYTGEGFFPEIFLNGRRVLFADHVLQRFTTRLENPVGEGLAHFLVLFYGSPLISMKIGPGLAFVVPFGSSLLAFPYREENGTFFITTCLTLHEMNSLDRDVPPLLFNHHYDLPFIGPEKRNWNTWLFLQKLYQAWDRKIPPPPMHSLVPKGTWGQLACRVPDVVKGRGFGPHLQISFMDDVPGPLMIEHAATTVAAPPVK